MANIEHLLDDIRKDKYCWEMRETFCNALIETNKAAEEMESTVKKIKNEITSVNANAEIIDARCGEKNLGDFNRKISSQLDTNVNSFKNGDFTKYFDTQYKGAEIYLTYDTSTYGTYQSIIDKLVLDNCNSLAIIPMLSMANKTDNFVTKVCDDSLVTSVFQYAKSKGLKTMLKCHYTGAVTGQYALTPSDKRAWIQSWSDNVMYYVNLIKNYLDGVCVVNEAVNVTSGNSDLWQTLHNNIKAINSNIFTVSASTKAELSSSVLFDIVDYIGCNLYIGVGGTDANTVRDLKPNMFRDVQDDIDWITKLLNIGKAKNKKIMITEVGCLPYNSGLSTPSAWNGSGGVSQTAQDIYYKIALGTFLNSSNIIGVFIWNACDGFTFIGNQAETTVRELFGGVN